MNDYSSVDFVEDINYRMYRAFRKAARHKRNTYDESQFEMRIHESINLLVRDVLRGEFHPHPGISFVITDPVIREIFAAPFMDRVIHHFLCDITEPFWENRLINDSYSCRKGKGTMYGIFRLARHMRQVSQNYQIPTTVAKFDIKSYFMSLPRAGLYESVMKGLNLQFPNGGPLYDICKYLWHEVIFDDPTRGVILRGSKEKRSLLPRSKSLFYQPAGRGIVIGNVTSQHISNIYLDPFDRFMMHTLGYMHYGRYVDDFFIVIPTAKLDKLLKDIAMVDSKLASLSLTRHPNKVYIQDINHGVEFLGVKVFPRRILPGTRIVHNYEESLLKYEMGISADRISIESYEGLMQHYNYRTIQQKIIRRVRDMVRGV